MKPQYKVTFINWLGKETTDTLTIHTSTFNDGSTSYYAENLLTLGCGKMGENHTEAIKRLVLDHGTKLIESTPL